MSSLVRIGKADAPGASTEASIFAAKGEYESFQIGIRAPTGGLTNVNVAASDLTRSGEGRIDASNLFLYREHYVYVSTFSPNRGGSNVPRGVGWYPDALIPFRDHDSGSDLSGTLDAVPFDLPEATNAAIWVDLYVPRGTPAGIYRGQLSVSSDQGEVAVPVAVSVWDFTLPERPALNSVSLLWTMQTSDAQAELLRHRLQPLEIAPENQRNLIENHGLKSTALGFWSGADANTCDFSPAPSVNTIRREMARHDPELLLYNFTADEVDDCAGVRPSLREWGQNLHMAGSTNRNLVVMVPDPALFDDGTGSGRSAVDIWVVLPRDYDENLSSVKQAQAKGDEVWSYMALVQDPYSPKWIIDYDPINFRISPGFISQRLELTGLLYWRVDRWKSDPWNEVNNVGDFGSGNYPGDGMLVYPGNDVGLSDTVVGSIRLKWVRDGVDDFDYIELLKRRGEGEWALALVGSVAPDWVNWTRDVEALEAARIALGERLHERSRREQARGDGGAAN